tara:strand:+ start:684 stop:1967 length:1284 start_codon:yes stop_codon:yes gene_type:complete
MREGKEMYNWARDIFPICRSITGKGVRDTLKYFKNIVPELEIKNVKTGEKFGDWEVPYEWNIDDAYILDPNNNKIIDFKLNNLHLWGYSEPIDKTLDLNELQNHLYSLEDYPDVIPYVTSYYDKTWGFCISHNQRKTLKKGKYKVVIKSSLTDGELNYGEIILKGKSKKEILISSYICHPSMGNNELSGPCVLISLVKNYLKELDRDFTYRLVLIPETIGSVIYINKHLNHLKKNVFCGLNLSCVGDNKSYSYLKSRNGNTFSDKVANYLINQYYPETNVFSYLSRGSDERNYCWPGVDLPIISLMRTKYGAYKEYHTSDDNLEFISPEGLQGGYEINLNFLKIVSLNKLYKSTTIGEPFLSRHGLRNKRKGNEPLDLNSTSIINFLVYSDGRNDLIDICEKTGIDLLSFHKTINLLVEKKIVDEKK